jgi:hypothetical protein
MSCASATSTSRCDSEIMAVKISPGPRTRLIAGLLLTTIPLWLLAWHFRVRNPLFVSRHIPVHNAWTVNRETFIHEWLENQIGSSANRSAISLLCSKPETKWRPSVVLDLDDAYGGIGNVRGNIFDFLGLAVLTGSSIMLPSFQSRSAEDLSALWNGKIPFTTFFDTDHFIATFAAACPKMDIHMPSTNHSLLPPLANRYGMPSMRQDLWPETKNTATPNTPEAAVIDFNHWLSVQPDYDPKKKTTLVSVGRTLWEGLDTRALPTAVRRDFGNSLRLIPEVRRLAAIVTYNLALKYHLHSIDPRLPYYPSSFLGAHLRTENDAKAAGWLNDIAAAAHANYTGQTDAYLLKLSNTTSPSSTSPAATTPKFPVSQKRHGCYTPLT